MFFTELLFALFYVSLHLSSPFHGKAYLLNNTSTSMFNYEMVPMKGMGMWQEFKILIIKLCFIKLENITSWSESFRLTISIVMYA